MEQISVITTFRFSREECRESREPFEYLPVVRRPPGYLVMEYIDGSPFRDHNTRYLTRLVLNGTTLRILQTKQLSSSRFPFLTCYSDFFGGF